MNPTTVSGSGAVTLGSARREYWLGRIDWRPSPGSGPALESAADEASRQLASYLEWLELSVSVGTGMTDRESSNPQAA